MTDSASSLRDITVLVRDDGNGELRERGEVTRMHAEGADELRGALMERVLEMAYAEQVPLRVTIIDVDGVYELECSADGDIHELGEARPLRPGENELTQRHHDGGYHAQFGAGQDVPVPTRAPKHETEQLPREAMMARLDYDALLSGTQVADFDEDVPLRAGGLAREQIGRAHV